METIINELFSHAAGEVSTVICLDRERVYVQFRDEASLIVPRSAYIAFCDRARQKEQDEKAESMLRILSKFCRHGVCT